MATSVSSLVHLGRPLRSASATECVSRQRLLHSDTVFSLHFNACAISMPVQPIPRSVMMAARSTSVSWSKQPVGRPYMDRGEEGAGGTGVSAAALLVSGCSGLHVRQK